MLIFTAGVFLAALIGLVLGFRGRRIDDHPICRKCGFDLVGTFPQISTCPECGRSLTQVRRLPFRAPVRLGKRRRSGRLIATTLVCLLLSLVVGAALAWNQFAGSDWYAHKPTWWLMLDTRNNSPAIVEPALAELQNRLANKQLSEQQFATLIARGLAWQADAKRTWVKAWGDLIENAWLDGKLSDEQKKSYAAHAVSPVLVARDKVKQGSRVAAAVKLNARLGSAGLLCFELSLQSMALGDQALLGKPCFASGSLDSSFPSDIEFAPEEGYSGMHGHVFKPSDATVTCQPGNHLLNTAWKLRVGEPGANARKGMMWGRRSSEHRLAFREQVLKEPPLCERAFNLSVAVEVVDPATATVELVHDDALAETVRSAIRIDIEDQAAESYRSAGRRASLWINKTPIDLAFSVVVKGGSKEYQTVFVHEADSMGTSIREIEMPGASGDVVYEATLTPNPERATHEVGFTKILGETLVFQGLTVQQDSDPDAVAQSEGGIQIMATLRLPPEDRLAGPGHSFRSVALRMPVVYVGDRQGDIYIFEVDEKDRHQSKEAVKVVKGAGDGNDLKVVGDVLLCTNWSRLVVYSLAKPTDPEHLGVFGPTTPSQSSSLVVSGNKAFVLGKQRIVCYDLTEPSKPELISVAEPEQYLWAGCARENYLYAVEFVLRAPNLQSGSTTFPTPQTSQKLVRSRRRNCHMHYIRCRATASSRHCNRAVVA